MTRGTRGFTLMEVLVAMGVFTLLGFGATAFLLMGLKTWRLAESRRDAAERAELVFAALAEDINCLYTDSTRAAGRALLYSDYDKEGRQRLHLTRTVPPPGADPRLARAGGFMMSTDTIDGVGDRRSLNRGLLRPPGDLASVMYAFGDEEEFTRAARTPEYDYRSFLPSGTRKGAQLLAEGVMHVEYNFWSHKTMSWQAGEKLIGPSYFWDSTLAIGKENVTEAERRSRFVFTGSGSLADPLDDRFPRLVEIKIVLSMPHQQGFSFLAADLAPGDKSIPVEWAGNYPDGGGEHFVKIDKEWISYKRVKQDGSGFEGVLRGRRGTRAALHPAGRVVRYGVAFREVLRPPCQREAWEKKT